MPAPSDYAVFTEFSPESKLMKPGWNRRVFTDTDARKGDAIQCDFATGIVTLAPGAYHISGLSMVAYTTGSEPPETTSIQSPASAGYCRLRALVPGTAEEGAGLRELPNKHPSILSIGSPTTANLSPSLLETFYETHTPARIVLEHQSGSNPEQIYLRVFVQNSKWHAFARLSIRRL